MDARKICKFTLLIFMVTCFGIWFGPHPAIATDKRKVITQKNASDQKNGIKDGIIECIGVLRFKNKISIHLAPGEKVIHYFVKNGMDVKKNSPLVQLENYALMEQYAGLQEKLLGIKQKQYPLELSEIKIDEAQKMIQRIQKRIDAEQKINAKIPSYKIEEKVNIWIEQIKDKESNVRILKKELEISKKQIHETAFLVTQIEKQLESTQKRINRLLITAPFAGKITGIPLDYQTTSPGNLILELYDKDSLEVEAKAWQHHLLYIEPGCKAQIFIDRNQNIFVKGIVRSIGIEGIILKEGGFPFFPVMINLETIQKEMRPGMIVMTKIQTRQKGSPNSQ